MARLDTRCGRRSLVDDIVPLWSSRPTVPGPRRHGTEPRAQPDQRTKHGAGLITLERRFPRQKSGHTGARYGTIAARTFGAPDSRMTHVAKHVHRRGNGRPPRGWLAAVPCTSHAGASVRGIPLGATSSGDRPQLSGAVDTVTVFASDASGSSGAWRASDQSEPRLRGAHEGLE